MSNVGAYDIINNTMYNYMMDHGVGKEDANTIVTMLLMIALRKSKGHNALLLVMDCCSSGNCALVDWMLTFVVDQLHWFHAAGVIYLWNLHGKGPADTIFGQHSEPYQNRSLFSETSLQPS
jgi:hypothetical protein